MLWSEQRVRLGFPEREYPDPGVLLIKTFRLRISSEWDEKAAQFVVGVGMMVTPGLAPTNRPRTTEPTSPSLPIENRPDPACPCEGTAFLLQYCSE